MSVSRSQIMGLVSAFAVAGFALAGNGLVVLNDYAVKDGTGAIQVLGTAGSWSNKGDVKEKVFDGNASTFFDPPSGQGVENAWAGIALSSAGTVTKVRYAGRSSFGSRMVGCMFQGANSADFSDAETFLVAMPPSGWDGAWVEEELEAEYGPYTYLRVYGGAYCGNAAEVEFVGYLGSPASAEPPLEGPKRPTASVAPGFYPTNVTVALEFPVEGAEIFYTLDGSKPVGSVTANCFRYQSPLRFEDVCSRTNRLALIPTNPKEMWSHAQYGWKAPSADQPNVNVLRARAFLNGRASTNELVGTWLVGSVPNQHSLRVVSLQTDERNFFGDAKGIMVPGNVYNSLGWNGHSVGLPNANYFQHGDYWERPVHFELFETNREQVVAQQLGVRMHGAWSRSCAQKTMGFYAREEYGKKKLKYQLFRDDSLAEFKRFLLRNSGNDWYKTGFRDAVGQSLFRGWVQTGTQGYEPSVVYINGEYWGIMNFRHHYSKQLFEAKYGVDPDNVDYLKLQRDSSNPYEVQEGDAVAYNELLDYLKQHDFATDTAAYEYVCTRIDVDDMIEHDFIHMFLGNTDWPDNNQGFWRERVEYSSTAAAPHDGRWRFCAYDTDHGLGLGCNVDTDMVSYAKKHQFFASLCANRDFINRFSTRCADLLNSALAPERTTAMLDAAAARVRSEIPRHIARWSRQGSLSAWENEVKSVRSFLAQRGDKFRAHLNNYFSVGSANALTVAANGNGRVKVNTLESGAGEGRIALPFTGKYFANVPVALTAIPEPGWRFVAWVVGEEAYTNATLEIAVTAAKTATAWFRETEPPNLVVNEVMADADVPDWFELYNAGNGAADLGGCWLTDDSELHFTEVPVGVVIPAGGFLLVRADDSQVPGMGTDGVLNVPFGLGKKGDEVNLWNADRTRRLAHVVLGAATKNVSVGSWPNGSTNAEDWVAMSVATPGAPNRSPEATGAWLPDGVATQVVAGAQVRLDCAVTNNALAGSYSVEAGDVVGARISAEGVFTWKVPKGAAAGARVFRIRWSATGGTPVVPVVDEMTVIVQVMRSGDDEELPLPPPKAQMGATRQGTTPLVYWTRSEKAVRYEVERATKRDGEYAKVATLGSGASHWLDASATTTTNWYRIVSWSRHELSSVSKPQRAWASGFVHPLEGLIVGTSGSWENGGNTIYKAFDGSTSTYFDAPGKDGWLGLDLGETRWRVVCQVRYWPRKNWSSRMVGSKIQVGSESDGSSTFVNPVTIYTISSQPSESQWTTVSLAATNEWRYVRYSNTGGYGNIAEFEVSGHDEVPAAPATLVASTNQPMLAELTWTAVPRADGYLVWTNGVVSGYVSTNTATFARSSKRATTFGVSAVNGSGQSTRRQLRLAKAPPPPAVLIFR